MLRGRRLALLPLAALVGTIAALAVAGVPAAPAQSSAPQARSGKLAVGVAVLGFNARGRRATGRGVVTATLTDNSGKMTTVHTAVALTASTGGSCKVLHLYLQQLNLTLLGLNAHLDKVVLDITGNRNGGVLGSLFCTLAHAHIASARASAARALNTDLARHHRGSVHFTVFIHPQVASSSAANTTCPVLDLVVGPLNLQLLGLVVDLKKVHLNITATRGQGALGDLFCQLADNSTTTTTTSTTTSTH